MSMLDNMASGPNKLMVHRHIGRIATLGNRNPPTANLELGGIKCIPACANIGFEPGVQIHGLQAIKITYDQACGNTDTAA